MGSVLPFRARSIIASVRREAKVPRVAVDLFPLLNGRFEVTLRRPDGFAPVCVRTFASRDEALRCAWDQAEHRGIPLHDHTDCDGEDF